MSRHTQTHTQVCIPRTQSEWHCMFLSSFCSPSYSALYYGKRRHCLVLELLVHYYTARDRGRWRSSVCPEALLLLRRTCSMWRARLARLISTASRCKEPRDFTRDSKAHVRGVVGSYRKLMLVVLRASCHRLGFLGS